MITLPITPDEAKLRAGGSAYMSHREQIPPVVTRDTNISFLSRAVDMSQQRNRWVDCVCGLKKKPLSISAFGRIRRRVAGLKGIILQNEWKII